MTKIKTDERCPCLGCPNDLRCSKCDDWRDCDRYRAYYRARMAEIRRLFTVREVDR